jgi:hypothetical protein
MQRRRDRPSAVCRKGHSMDLRLGPGSRWPRPGDVGYWGTDPRDGGRRSSDERLARAEIGCNPGARCPVVVCNCVDGWRYARLWVAHASFPRVRLPRLAHLGGRPLVAPLGHRSGAVMRGRRMGFPHYHHADWSRPPLSGAGALPAMFLAAALAAPALMVANWNSSTVSVLAVPCNL